MPMGCPPPVGRGTPVKTPAVVIRPMLFPVYSVNQSAPSGPTVIHDPGPRPPVTGYSLNVPISDCVPITTIRPIMFAEISLNQMLLSGPATTVRGLVVTGNSVICPEGVMRAMFALQANHRLPSGPAAIPDGTHVVPYSVNRLLHCPSASHI